MIRGDDDDDNDDPELTDDVRQQIQIYIEKQGLEDSDTKNYVYSSPIEASRSA